MNDYEILADASADLDPSLISTGEIGIIPMRYMLGDEEKTCYERRRTRKNGRFIRRSGAAKP